MASETLQRREEAIESRTGPPPLSCRAKATLKPQRRRREGHEVKVIWDFHILVPLPQASEATGCRRATRVRQPLEFVWQRRKDVVKPSPRGP